jgi:hypothetical protein
VETAAENGLRVVRCDALREAVVQQYEVVRDELERLKK